MTCRKILTLALLSLLVAFTTGCCPKLKPFQVTVIADESIRGYTVAVHLVGVNPQDNNRWTNYSMTKYWAPGDTLHNQQGVYTKILFDPTSQTTQALTREDPVWDTWLKYGATDLFLVANLPLKEDHAGNADARRQIIPINNCRYFDELSGHSVTLRLTKDGIRLETPLAPQR